MKFLWKDITLDSKKLIESYTKRWTLENAEMSFAHMYMWGLHHKIQYAEWNRCLYFLLDFPEEAPYIWAPIPEDVHISLKGYQEAVSDGLQYLSSLGVKPCMRSVAAPFVQMIADGCPNLEVTPTEWNSDYVYASEDLIFLKGKKYHGKRNHISKFKSLYPDYQYQDITSGDTKECMELYNRWLETHHEHTIEQYEEKASIEAALTDLEALGLTGGCIRINGQMKAFTIGERIQEHMCQIHIEKADDDIDGLYPIINQEYAAHHCADATFINREEDMGLEGLRRAKRSYKPIKMIDKFNVFCVQKAPASDGCTKKAGEPCLCCRHQDN